MREDPIQSRAREQRRREDRELMGCVGGVALLLLLLVGVVFVGCPAALSYGVSRGCAAGVEHAR